MAKNYREILRQDAKKLAVNTQSSLDHSTAKGDMREELLLEFLKERVGSAFGVTKAEVIDSRGRTTGEFDSVVYDRRTAAAVAVEADRRVVRVEAVVATIEIKSDLKAEDLKAMFERGNKGLLQLTRFYNASVALRALGPRTAKWAETETILRDGLNPMLHHESIPGIVSFAFGFNGASKDTALDRLHVPGVDVVCVLDQFTGAKRGLGFASNPPELELWAEGDDALGAFLFLVEQSLDSYLEARSWVSPAWRRYFLSPELLRAESPPTP